MKYLLFIIFLAFSNLTYAQKVTINKQYNPVEIETVSFTPYFDEQGKPNPAFNNMISEALSKSFTVCCQKELEYNLLNNETFNDVARRTLYSGLSELIKTKSSLFNDLSNREILALQNGCKNTDLIVITSKIDSRTIRKPNNSGSISVSGNITVFDLRTGEFAAFISDEVKLKFGDMQEAVSPVNELVISLVNGMNEALEK